MIRRFRKVVAAVVLVVLVAVGCSSDGFPESYDAQPDEQGISNVEMNWTEGCEPVYTEELADKAVDVCACAYQDIKQSVPFIEFVEFNDRMAANPESFAAEIETTGSTARAIADIIKDCVARS